MSAEWTEEEKVRRRQLREDMIAVIEEALSDRGRAADLEDLRAALKYRRDLDPAPSAPVTRSRDDRTWHSYSCEDKDCRGCF